MTEETPPLDEQLREMLPPPPHGFVGRDDELRQAERVLGRQRHLTLHGEHGEGKSTLAAELVRRLLDAGRVERAAYVSLEVHHDARGVRYSIGQQLVPSYRLATSQDPRLAVQLLERVLEEHPTVVVIDDLEGFLPPGAGTPSGLFEPTVLDQVLLLTKELCEVGPTRVVLVSRGPLPAPFDDGVIEVGALPADDAVALVRGVLSETRVETRELRKLAERVGAHAASLVSLARSLAVRGVDGAEAALDAGAETIAGLADGERRRAVLLGVEIALQTLPAALRGKLAPLGVFVGGGHLTAIAAVLELDVESDEEVDLAERLIEAGLAEMLPHNYLRFHPELAAALAVELDAERMAAARSRWVEATTQLLGFLGQEQIKSPQLAAGLTLLDLGNLLGCLEHFAAGDPPDRVVELADALEALVLPLGRPAALERIDALRDGAFERLKGWTHEQYLMETAALEVMMDVGRPHETVAAARRLLHRAATLGERAYDGADFDLAHLYLTTGLAELMADDAEAAAAALAEAERRFHQLAATGRDDAARLEAQAVTGTGDALRALERPAAAEATYRRAVALAERAGEHTQAAESKTRLGALHVAQDRIDEALAVFEEARLCFIELEEPRAEAGIWRQIAAVHESVGRFDRAHEALARTLRIESELGDRLSAAGTLSEIAELYAMRGRDEEAHDAYRRAAELFHELGDLAKEGIARSQMADKLVNLRRFDEARRQLERTIECDAAYGHEAEPWRTFSLLAHLEEQVGDEGARRAARDQAVQAYLAYRRDGGASQGGRGPIFREVTRAIRDGETAEVAAKIDAMRARSDVPGHLRALIPALEAVLAGSRDSALAADPELYYRDAAELLLMLETLEGASEQVPDVTF